MKITEVPNTNSERLVALSQFLLGRADNVNTKREISQTAFINLAKSLGVVITADTLGELVSRPPLSNLMEPFQPNSGVIRFKGNTEAAPNMSVDQARNVVDKNAKAAMRRGMNK